MNYKEVIKQIKKKEYRPIYFLHGEEAFFLDKISDCIEHNILNEAQRSFDLTVFYGKDSDSKAVVDAARRYPMLSTHQVIIVKEAQDMKSLTDLLNYVEKPTKTTILVLVHKHKKLDMRSKFAKAISQHAFVFESAKIYENQAADWVSNYLTEHGLQIKSDAAALIAEYLGTDLSKISNELDKLALNVPKGAMINTELIEKNIGISKDYNVFELQKALGARDVLKANRIVQNFAANPRKNPFVVVVSSLFSYFSKIYMLHFVAQGNEVAQLKALNLRNEYALRDYKAALKNYNYAQSERIIGYLKDYDLRSKGVNNVNVEEGELLKELVFKILH
jgi:DNA polymerase III subunit delta